MSFKTRRSLRTEKLEPRMLMAAHPMLAAGPPAGLPSVVDDIPAYVTGDVGGAPVISGGATAESAHAVGEIWPDTISLPDEFEPKGIELGKGQDFFVSGSSWSSLLGPVYFGVEYPVSPNAGAIYKGNLRTGEGAFDGDPDREFLVEPTGRPLLGLSYDARTDSIYAAVMDPGVAGSGEPLTNVGIVVYNGTTGEKIDEILIDDDNGPFLSGILVTRSGVFATSTDRATLYKLPLEEGGRLPSSPAFEEIEMSGFQGVNGFYAWGLEGSFDGNDLVILNGLNGSGVLYHVDTTSGVSAEIKIHGAQQSFEGGDELYLSGRTLYISQVFSNNVAVVQLSGDLTEGTFVGDITSGDVNFAHSIVGFGDSIYAANMDFFNLGTTDYQTEVVRLDKLTANMKGGHLASSTRESGNFIQAVNAHYSELGDALHQSNAAKPKKLGPVDLDLLRFLED